MKWSIKLFEYKDIDVKVHLTFLLILVWAAYNWSANTGEGWMGALFGVIATLLLFGSVLLHEFGHSLQALRFGVPVPDITLLPMGGVSRIEEMPESSDQELKIALSGPLVNFAIAAVLIALGMLLNVPALVSLDRLGELLRQVSWTSLLVYLTAANIALGLFNLIPAYPMDGGRVLRALLASRMDYAQATRIAVGVGQGLAFLLGLWGFMNGSFILILIGIFVWMGAEGEGKNVQVKSVLQDVQVSRAMTRTPHTLSPEDPLSKAIDITLSTAQSDFPVVNPHSGKVVGLLTAADLLKGLKTKDASQPVRGVMRQEFGTIRADTTLYQAQKQMANGQAKSMVVVNAQGELRGLLTSQDIDESYRLLSVQPELAEATS